MDLPKEPHLFLEEILPVLESVPVLSGTILGLEMLVHELHVDVRVATELVLNDVGASIQVLSRAGFEYSRALCRPDRIAECIAALDIRELIVDLSDQSIACDVEQAAMAAVWNHCRRVAGYASMAAESIGEISAEEAYLAGLLDDRGSIGEILGWPKQVQEMASVGDVLASVQLLPESILGAFCPPPQRRRSEAWEFILSTAHELAGMFVPAS